MGGPAGFDDRDRDGVLARRLEIPEASHPRVSVPTLAALVARSGPSEPTTVDADATVLDALKRMAERDFGAVAVVSPAGLLGLFTERDHARDSLLGNRTPQNTPVVDLMNPTPLRLAPGDTVHHALEALRERRLTHLVVMDRDRLVAVLSETDLSTALIDHHRRIFHEEETDRKLLFLRGVYSC